ncbi:TM2 domain-containing protein [Deinococcus malanensis]|uniref:TM2 domain-containing protein n=1 Tax=Deinococcus malanensis TaxID=1706855 RepID=UPI003629F789
MQEPFDSDDWIARATGGSAKSPLIPQGAPAEPPAQARVDPWGDAIRQAQAYVQQQPMTPYNQGAGQTSGDVAQRKLIAGLLGIFLGWLGAHKFYLGMTGAGLTMLGVQVGVWIVAIILGLLMLIVGLALTLPLAALVSSAVGVLGLIEGILYLTKSDADFERDYLIGKKPWL